jgi:AhpD family alkylhydroperoxidase
MEKPRVEEVLVQMEKNMGEKPKPMIALAKCIPEMVIKQAEDSKFVMELPSIPAKYKNLIMMAVAAATASSKAASVFGMMAKRSGASKEEIAEAIIVARMALANTVLLNSSEALEQAASVEGETP